MYKARNILLLTLFAVLSACNSAPQQIETGKPATVTPNEAAPVVTATEVSMATARPTLGPDEWKNLPIVPTVSDTARAIYQHGLELGNDPHVFSKVGDCQTSTDFFLVDFDHPGQYSLGDEHAELQSTIDYYQGSFSRQSLAVKDGFNVAAVLSPLRADPKQCNAGETPLACEYRLNRPTVALISMETNFKQRTAEEYGKYMRQIVTYTISQGIVPVLGTKADDKEGNNSINIEIAMIANEYDIPVWNFWAAAHPLPNNGFDTGLNDGFHLSFSRNFFDDPKNMLSAWPWRNLTALEVLDAMRKELGE